MALTTGWLIVANGVNTYKVQFEDWSLDWESDPIFQNIFSDINIGLDLEKRKRVVSITGALFNNQTDCENFRIYMDTWSKTASFNLQIQTSTTPTYFKFSTGATTLTVICTKMTKTHKVTLGDEQAYKIENLTFRQAD